MFRFAVLFLFSGALIESRVVEGPEASASWWKNINFRNGIVGGVLESRGTSADDIQDIIAASNDDVSGINAAFNENLLRVEGRAVRVHADAILNIGSAGQSTINQKLPESPSLASALENGVRDQINAQNGQFEAVVASSAVPLDLAKRSLLVRERSIQPRLDLIGVISDLINSILQTQSANLLNGLLDNVKNLLEGLLIVSSPGNPFGDFLAGIVNFAVKGLIQIITDVQQTLIAGTAASASSLVWEAYVRERRDD